MQDLLLEEDCSLMPDERIELSMISRVDSEQKATASRVEGVDEGLRKLEREVSEIKGILRTNETPVWVRHYVYPCCVLISAAMVAAVIVLMVQMHGVQSFLSSNAGFIAGLRLQQSVSGPTTAQSVREVKEILSSAERKHIQLPASAVEEAGNKFVQASATDPQAWNVVLQLAQYRTLLNANALPPLPDLRRVDPNTYPATMNIWPDNDAERATQQTPHKQLNSEPAVVWLEGHANPEMAAIVERLSKPNSVSSDARFILFDWTRPDVHVVLDRMHFKNVILRNARIYYSGGPVVLENVYFVNCTFEGIRQQQSGQDFAKALFDAAAMNFHGA